MALPADNDLVEYFEFLDGLRESGATNMFAAGSYLRRSYDLDRQTASAVLSAWMDTFDRESGALERAQKAIAEQVAS